MISMSYQYLVGVTTVSCIIHETCQAIWDILYPLVLPGRPKERNWLDIANDYENSWNFVHCIGAIDGKHIIIQVRKFNIRIEIIFKKVQFNIIILIFSVPIMLDQHFLIISTVTA